MFSTGIRLASVLTQELRGTEIIREGVSYAQLEQVVYTIVSKIGEQQLKGDWLELPTGTTYTLSFKPEKRYADANR